ncbi:MAG: lysozyme inhibitor LprI family protein [Sphingomicrobium sp.]
MRITSFTLILAASLATLACGPRNKDKLEDNELAAAQGGKGPAGATGGPCDTRTTHDEVKRQLFARAAEIRGSNGDNYQRIAGFALIQVDGAAPASSNAEGALVECRGHATLRLPAGLKVAGGRTTLGGDIGYSVVPGPRGTLTLGQSDTISIPLATLTQNRTAGRSPSREPAADADFGQTAARAPIPERVAPTATARPTPPAPAPGAEQIQRPRPEPTPAREREASSGSARPSFDCGRARTAGERAVCSSDSLAALDRTMASQYRSAAANGGPEERRLLVQTRNRFLGYRDRCSTDACIANAYRGRMREIDDIMSGRWRGER